MSSSKRLLILACSQRKRRDAGLLPAVARYDGGSYRVLRKAKRDGLWPENLDVLILSAKYGLIEASTSIADYEQRMTQQRAKELKTQVTDVLRVYAQKNYDEVYVDVGQDYWPAIEELADVFGDFSVIYAQGRIGQRLGSLKNWIVQNQ
jgi:cytoplasmic iron level regulating protein YaaA (DUF328/UPF0246 family)